MTARNSEQPRMRRTPTDCERGLQRATPRKGWPHEWRFLASSRLFEENRDGGTTLSSHHLKGITADDFRAGGRTEPVELQRVMRRFQETGGNRERHRLHVVGKS